MTKANKRRAAKPKVVQGARRSRTMTKIAQLEQMLSRSSGANLVELEKKLGWQKHTVRAAISRLRRGGLTIITGKNAKTRETIYQIEFTMSDAGNRAAKKLDHMSPEASHTIEVSDTSTAA